MGSLTRKHISLLTAFLVAVTLAYAVIDSLSRLDTTIEPEIFLRRSVLALMGFFFPIFMAWSASRSLAGILFAVFASAMAIFVSSVSHSPFTVWFILEYGLLCFVLYEVDETYENQIANQAVDREKYQNEKNDLELLYKTKGEGISIFFEKYSTYYNLRKFAEELAKTLSVTELAKMAVDRTADFIPRGDLAMVLFADEQGEKLSVVASRKIRAESRVTNKDGDMFDQWALRNRKRLIVNDTHQDFRFDVSQSGRHQKLRSVIIAPLFHERRVMGVLRVNSSQRETFTNDDLRLLDAISTLASSAFSSAMLYEQTEELAIRDSLTGTYVRRYFFERLKQEHRRAMMSHRPLSLLMCDLDNFKDCNDRFGHGVGDQMLVSFADTLKKNCEHGLVSRYGGEEFVLLLPDVKKEEAAEVAERIRKNVEAKPFSVRRTEITMTVSIGVASVPKDAVDRETLVQKADEAMYQAKKKGRNRVCLSGA